MEMKTSFVPKIASVAIPKNSQPRIGRELRTKKKTIKKPIRDNQRNDNDQAGRATPTRVG